VEIGAHEEGLAGAFAVVAVVSVDHRPYGSHAGRHRLDDEVAEMSLRLGVARIGDHGADDAFGSRAHQVLSRRQLLLGGQVRLDSRIAQWVRSHGDDERRADKWCKDHAASLTRSRSHSGDDRCRSILISGGNAASAANGCYSSYSGLRSTAMILPTALALGVQLMLPVADSVPDLN